MKTPKRTINQAIRRGFEWTGESVTSGIPEVGRRVEGKMLRELENTSVSGPDTYRVVVPYTAQYSFGGPRAARVNEKGF